MKVWNLGNCKLRTNLVGHSGVVYTATVSPDGSLCASGGKDATAMLWDVNDGKHLYSLDAGSACDAGGPIERPMMAERHKLHKSPKSCLPHASETSPGRTW